LGIDTATDILNLAITENNSIEYEFKINKVGITHSAILIPLIKKMFDFTGYRLNEIDAIAVSIGPGSFTGLRIGLATSKGLAFALSVPLVGINTLESYALQWIDLPGILCPIIKARKGEYYFTLYQINKKNNKLIKKEDYLCKKWVDIKISLFFIFLTICLYILFFFLFLPLIC